MTKLTPPNAETGINPRLAALAVEIDEAEAHARVMEAHEKDGDDFEAEDRARDKVYTKISNLRDRLANVIATNLEELMLKARYADDEEVTESIIRDLLALDASPRPQPR